MLDATTGKDAGELNEQGTGENFAHSFSHDGRLLVGDCGTSARPGDLVGRAESVLAVWDTASGMVLKKWPHSARSKVKADFAPKRPVLAVVETWGPATGGKGRNPLDDRPNTSTLGFWDLSGLLK